MPLLWKRVLADFLQHDYFWQIDNWFFWSIFLISTLRSIARGTWTWQQSIARLTAYPAILWILFGAFLLQQPETANGTVTAAKIDAALTCVLFGWGVLELAWMLPSEWRPWIERWQKGKDDPRKDDPEARPPASMVPLGSSKLVPPVPPKPVSSPLSSDSEQEV